MATEGIGDFARDYIVAQCDAWERGDFSGLRALEHPEVRFTNINGTVFEGRDAHFAAIEGMKASFDGAAFAQEWHYLAGDGSIFSLSYEWLISTPGQPTVIAGILVGRIEGGLLVEEFGANYVVER
jgi:hypothetical protein